MLGFEPSSTHRLVAGNPAAIRQQEDCTLARLPRPPYCKTAKPILTAVAPGEAGGHIYIYIYIYIYMRAHTLFLAGLGLPLAKLGRICDLVRGEPFEGQLHKWYRWRMGE